MKHIALYMVLLWISFTASAQDVSFTASAPSSVLTGQQFRLVYTVNAQGSGFKAPDLSDFNILAGPSTSSSSNISFINGQMSQSFSYSYTYILQAKSEGSYTIQPASITVDGKKITSNPLTINVGKGQQQAQQQQQQAQQSSGSDDDLLVRIILSKEKVYQGEQLVATIKIYTRVNLVGFEEFKFPTYKGFWAEEVEIPNQIQLQQENFNGKVYNAGVLKKTLLFPQKSGEITIEPFEMKLMVQERVQQSSRNFWDSFFNTYQTVSKRLVSPPVKVTVLPLPSAPDGFNGAVGNFTLSGTATPLQLKSNESLSIIYKLSGTGNLRLAEFPKPKFPPQFEAYDPKVTDQVKVSANGISGSRISEQLLIPRSAGKFTITSPDFVFFNPTSRKYETIHIEPFEINVEKGNGDSSVAFVSGFNKEDLTLLGSDIRFIKTQSPEMTPVGWSLFKSPLYAGSYILAFLAFVTVVISRRNYIRRNADMMMVRNRRAGKEAARRLSQARKLMQKQLNDSFYEEVLKALWGYYADKLKIPVSQLNREIIVSKLKDQNIDENMLTDINQVIDECELSRYAPAGSYASPPELYQKAVNVINESEKKIK